MRFATVDCDKEKNLCRFLKVQSFPKYQLFVDSLPQSNYVGPKSAAGFVHYLANVVLDIELQKDEQLRADAVLHYHHLYDFTATVLEQQQPTLLAFTTPNCGHCKHLKPQFEVAALQLAKEASPATLAVVDCTDNVAKKICARYSITRYPTLLVREPICVFFFLQQHAIFAPF